MALNFLNNGAFTGSLTVGADADSHDVLFYGNATGEKMEWDASESRLILTHDTDDSGLDVFTVSGATMTQPQLRVGRDPFQYWGVYTDDRNAHLVHRQDETGGAMTTRFDQWDNNTGSQAGSWQWRVGDGSGGSMATALTLTQAGVATFAGLVSGITPTSDANFATKAYVDGAGAGTFLPLTGGTLTGNLQIIRPSTSNASFSLRRDATGENDTVGEINYLTTAAPGGDNRLFILRTATQGGTTTTRGGKVTFFSRKIDGGFNASTYDNEGNWVFANNAIVNGNIGLGTTNPVSQLNSTKVIKLQSTGNNEIILDHTDGGVGSDLGLYSWERNNDHLAHIRSAHYTAIDDAFISFHCQPTGGSFSNASSNEKMRILPTGNVGIATTTPGFVLDIGSNLNSNNIFRVNGVTSKVIFSGQNVVSTGENGVWNFVNSGSGAGTRFYVEDKNNIDARLTFRFTGNGGANEILAGSSTGNVGIGTTAPNSLLHMAKGSGLTFKMERTYTIANASDRITHNYVGGSAGYVFAVEGTNKMTIAEDGDVVISGTTTATNFILSSDERLKENIKETCDNRIKADWKTFELKSEKGQKRYGVIAQELEKTNPEFVREDIQGFKSVAYIDLLIAKIAELEARLEKAGI